MLKYIVNKLYPNYYQNKYKVYVFDLDNTITNKHTGGYYQEGTYREYITNEMLIGVKDMFKKIKENGGMIYINSRGIASKVHRFVIDTGLFPFITGIYAANYDGKKYSHGGIVTEYRLDHSRWQEIKGIYLTKIMQKENIDIKNIYYFDDDKQNINFAKNIGFKNSYLVNSNEHMNITDSYNLINVFNNIK